MIRRILSLSVVALLALPAISVRGEDAGPVSRAEFASAIAELKQAIQSLKAPAVPAPPATTGTTGGTAGSVAATASNSDTDLTNRVATLEAQVAKLQQEKKELTNIASELHNIANNHALMLRDIATSRQTPDGGQRYVPNVQAISDDHDARRVLVDTVVHDMTRSTGELRIRNDMSTGQSLMINGVDTVYVPAHALRIVTVPSGTATTELAGEAAKSWMIGAPNYSQEVIIAPAVRNTMVSAGSPWQYDPFTGGWWRTLP